VNGVGIPVFPGLVVGFLREADARYFLDQPHRATRPYVEAGTELAFHYDIDAKHFIELGVAAELSPEDAERFVAKAYALSASTVVPMSKGKGGRKAAA